MRLFLTAFICLLATPLCLAQQVKSQNFNKVSLASVYDGDTFKVYLAYKYPIFCKAIPVRVRGVDCPEMRGGTPKTKAAANAANNNSGTTVGQKTEVDNKEVYDCIIENLTK